MKMLIVGDLHADTADVWTCNEAAAELDVDLLFGVGDFGYRFTEDFEKACNDAPVNWFFIRGNHDDTGWLRERSGAEHMWGEEPVQVSYNMWWCPDLSTLAVGNKTFGLQGGGFSIDLRMRTKFLSYWPDEIPTLAGEVPLPSVDADYMVSHDIPDRFWPLLSPFFSELRDHQLWVGASQSRRHTDSAYDFFGLPRRVVHGHYHMWNFNKSVISLTCNSQHGWLVLYDSNTDSFYEVGKSTFDTGEAEIIRSI